MVKGIKRIKSEFVNRKGEIEMSMNEWAKREVEIACKGENPERKDGEFDYGCACYESALKAFESLCGDGHSGYSICVTKNILNRLIDGKPLTPIEDTDDIWDGCGQYEDGDLKKHFQCKRMSSLFKDINEDETVSYSDVGRYVCVNINNPDDAYTGSLGSRIMNEMFPVTLPYMPATKRYEIYCEEFLTDKKNGDFDTVGVFYIIKPDGEKVEVNRFFKDAEKRYDEITREEFEQRKASKIK